jgi:hypothetical protein
MERNDLTTRLQAARPAAAIVDPGAFDAALLDRLCAQPVPPRRTVRRTLALPVAGGLVATATAVAVLAGGPGGPSHADAVTRQALHWLTPPAGTILHTQSVATQGGHTTTLEVWQSADDTRAERLRYGDNPTYETAGDAVYDPATDTIYAVPRPTASRADNAKLGAGRVDAKGAKLPPGDPIVDKVRTLLQDGQMTVGAETTHDGTAAFPISLNADAGQPVWTLWVSAADGRPLELRDPGRDANEAPQDIRWPTYEVLPGANADALLTLAGAHPSARVVSDPAQLTAAQQRLMGMKSSPDPAAKTGKAAVTKRP